MTNSEIRRVAIVGVGYQGARIAYRCAISNYEVVLYSKSKNDLEHGERELMGFLDVNLSVKEATACKEMVNCAANIEECVAKADLVIEAIPESLMLKRDIWAKIDFAAQEGTLICTNSSSLPCSRLADVIKRPDRAFNINFSDPVQDDLVEVMKGAKTSDETLIAGVKFVISLKMVPIITYKEIMGFSYNRVWRAIKREVLHLVDEGYADCQDLDRAWIMDYGTKIGPFGIMDKVGLDVVRDIENIYYEESGDERDKPPDLLEKMIAKGRLGVKTGCGFYEYPNPVYEDPAWLKKRGRYAEDIESKLAARKTENKNIS